MSSQQTLAGRLLLGRLGVAGSAEDHASFKGNWEVRLNIGQHQGLNMWIIESKPHSNQLLLMTPIPWDPLSSL